MPRSVAPASPTERCRPLDVARLRHRNAWLRSVLDAPRALAYNGIANDGSGGVCEVEPATRTVVVPSSNAGIQVLHVSHALVGDNVPLGFKLEVRIPFPK
jgi:hypothetical protein